MTSYKNLNALIKSSNGRIFTAQMTKKTGEERVMNCRIGVTSKLKGGVSTTAHKPNLVTVYDMVNKGYRSINLDTLKSLTIDGKTYNIS